LVEGPVFPPPGGTRLQIVRWPPDSAGPPEGNPQELYAEAEQNLPGALDAIRPDAAGNHATDTLDWNVVFDGEMVLVMEDGSESTGRFLIGPASYLVATLIGLLSPLAALILFIGLIIFYLAPGPQYRLLKEEPLPDEDPARQRAG
jgi:hypothetical protein